MSLNSFIKEKVKEHHLPYKFFRNVIQETLKEIRPVLDRKSNDDELNFKITPEIKFKNGEIKYEGFPEELEEKIEKLIIKIINQELQKGKGHIFRQYFMSRYNKNIVKAKVVDNSSEPIKMEILDINDLGYNLEAFLHKNKRIRDTNLSKEDKNDRELKEGEIYTVLIYDANLDKNYEENLGLKIILSTNNLRIINDYLAQEVKKIRKNEIEILNTERYDELTAKLLIRYTERGKEKLVQNYIINQHNLDKKDLEWSEMKEIINQKKKNLSQEKIEEIKDKNPVDECIGHKGSVIKKIQDELGIKHLTLIEWSKDFKTTLKRAVKVTEQGKNINKLELEGNKNIEKIKWNEEQKEFQLEEDNLNNYSCVVYTTGNAGFLLGSKGSNIIVASNLLNLNKIRVENI